VRLSRDGEPSDSRQGEDCSWTIGLFSSAACTGGTTLLAQCVADQPLVSGFKDTGVWADEGQHLQTVYPPAMEYGGAGRFAFTEEAHLDEASPLVSKESRERLISEWSRLAKSHRLRATKGRGLPWMRRQVHWGDERRSSDESGASDYRHRMAWGHGLTSGCEALSQSVRANGTGSARQQVGRARIRNHLRTNDRWRHAS